MVRELLKTMGRNKWYGGLELKMHIESTDKQGVFKACEQGHRLLELINDMGWDYDRFSSSGQETYDKICVILGTVEEDENETN